MLDWTAHNIKSSEEKKKSLNVGIYKGAAVAAKAKQFILF